MCLGLEYSPEQRAIQKLVDRVSEALVPHYEAIGRVARAAPVNHLDETLWFTHGMRQ